MTSPTICRVGLIADTHGLLRPQVLPLLAGCDHIIHAGDIGSAHVLEALRALAPVTAVRGNNDTGPWADALPEACSIALSGLLIHVLHDLGDLARLAPPPDARVVVAGHSHKPLVEQRGNLLIVNPGSAGPRRFKLPITVAELLITADGPHARIMPVDLEPAA